MNEFSHPLYYLSSLLTCFLFLTHVVVLLVCYCYISSISHNIYFNSIPFTFSSVNCFIYSFFFVFYSFLNYVRLSRILTLPYPPPRTLIFNRFLPLYTAFFLFSDTFHDFTCLRIYLSIHIKFSLALHLLLILYL